MPGLRFLELIERGLPGNARRVLSQAPVTDPMHFAWSLLEFSDRNFEAALAHAERMPRDEPSPRVWADWVRGEALVHLGRNEEAREIIQSTIEELNTAVASGATSYHSFIALGHARLGRKEDALREAQRQIEVYANDLFDRPLAEQRLALIYAILGDAEPAVDILDRLLVTPYDRAITVERLRLDPLLDPIRDDPRFQAMLEKHG